MRDGISIMEHFEGSTLETYPEFTEVKVSIHDPDYVKRFWSDEVPIIRTVTEQIPTVEIWEKGDWVARRFSGLKSSKVEAWLSQNGYHCSNYNFSIPN